MYYDKTEFKAGKLADHIDSWKDIGAPKHILNLISQGVKIPFVQKPEPFCLPNHVLSLSQETFLKQEIDELLQQGAIRKSKVKSLYILPIHCVRKAQNKWRFCLDL